MRRRTPRNLPIVCLAVLLALALGACERGSEDPDVSEIPKIDEPSHDIALFYLRECEYQDSRLMVKLAAEKLPPDEREAFLAHMDAIHTITEVSRHARTPGPLVDGCIRSAYVPPYRDRRPAASWRSAQEIAAIADTLAKIEAAGTSLEPQVDPETEPRYTTELAALLANLDQYARVEALLARLPGDGRSGWWKDYITTVVTVRRAVNENWRDYDACRTAIARLEELITRADRDVVLSTLSPVLIFDIGMLERHLRHHNKAVTAIERAMTHAISGGDFRQFLYDTWQRL